jgi:selenocysteine lyase/cysteine desulfurase
MRGARWLQADEFELAADATRFENWEFPYALVLGLGQAVRYALDIGLERIAARVNDVTAEIAGHEAREVMLRLREEAINTSATAREFAVLDMDDKRAETALRVSPHYYNTRREIDILSSALEEFTL